MTQIEKHLLIKQKKNSISCSHSHYNLFTENVPKGFDNSLSHLNIWNVAVMWYNLERTKTT